MTASRLSIYALIAGLLSGCSGPTQQPKPQAQRLHIWFDDTGCFQPPQMIQGTARYTGGRDDLPGIVYACGVREFETNDLGMGGVSVAFASGPRDSAIVGCVQRAASFGFNAARAVQRPSLGLEVKPEQKVRPPQEKARAID